MKKVEIRTKRAVSAEGLIAFSFVLYFAMSFFTRFLKLILGGYALYAAIAVTYLPVILLLVAARDKLRAADFLFLMLFELLFLGLTYLIHPDYKFFYTRNYYGVWDGFLRPDNGIYAYLFLRLAREPKKILKYLQISAFLMFIDLGIDFLEFLKNGYWLVSKEGMVVHASYHLEFGYDLLLYELVFLYSAFRSKKLIYWAMALLGLLMIMAGGSRGPIVDILIFVILYFLVMVKRSPKKTAWLIGLGAAAVLLLVAYKPILNGLSDLLSRMGLSSRFIKKLIEGDIADDNGRIEIWQRAIQMIKANPWGYGAMGARKGIYDVIIVGHPHNVFLEILIDYGVFVGGGLILSAGAALVRIFRMKDMDEWKGIVLIFLGFSCMLLLSGTYWHRICIWGLFAACMNIHYFLKRKERLQDDGR